VTFKKIALQFLIQNWKGVLIALLSLVLVGKMRYDYKQLENAYEATHQSLQAQIAGLQAIHQQELSQLQNSLQTYKDAMEQIENDYQRSQDTLEELRKTKREEYGRQFSQDPEALSEAIMLMYGFDYVP
jgi:DNA anti-recombination protein RmuC